MESRDDIAFDLTGSTGPLLVLLHGLGTTGAVWSRFAEVAPQRWAGRVLIPDLPGHGESAPLARYAIEDYSAALAPLVTASADGREVVLLGHSLGGLIALALANPDSTRAVSSVFTLGIKAEWSDEELDRFAGLSQRPPRVFATKEDAVGQHARMCGLDVSEDALLARGIVASPGGGFRLAFDSAALAIDRPQIASLIAHSGAQVHWARGVDDPMISETAMRAFDDNAVSIPDAGHNAMVDQPGAVWDWLMARRTA